MIHHPRKNPVCPNCSYNFISEENYCPNCGQENHELKIPLKHLLLELIEGIFHFDTKFFRTIRLLLFKPGVLSQEFNEGKRARFVPPFRLYIFISFIFFFLLSLASNSKKHNFLLATDPILNEKIQEKVNNSNNKLDSILLKEGKEASGAIRIILEQVRKLKTKSKEEISHKFLKNVSILMFFLMPLFAFLLHLFYYKKGKFYFELLTFSIHFHSFIFLYFILLLSINFYFDFNFFFLSACVFLFYTIIALRNFFNQSIAKTILKSSFLLLTYLSIIGSFLLITLVISVLLT